MSLSWEKWVNEKELDREAGEKKGLIEKKWSWTTEVEGWAQGEHQSLV